MAKSAEFILELERKQLLVLEPYGPNYEEALRSFIERPDLQTVECSSLREMAALARQVGICTVLAHCPGESSATELVALLRSCRQEIRERKIKVLITLSSDFVSLLPRLIREGAVDVLQQPVGVKSLNGKIARLLDELPSRDRNGKILPKETKEGGGPEIVWKAPLELRSDCWVAIEGKTQWVPAGKWAVHLLGPPPMYGEWSPCEDGAWEWIPNGLTDDPFIQDEGAWRFCGEKPEFKDCYWVFQGERPKLSFVRSKVEQGSKLEGNDESLVIAEDSEQGRRACALIEEALRKQLRVAREGPVEITFDPAALNLPSEPASAAAPAPGYLQRVPIGESDGSAKIPEQMIMSPIAAAFLISELMRDRELTPLRMLWRFCENLKAACGYGQIELWLHSASGWKCLQHNDLMDMSLRQKIEASTHEKILRATGVRAVPIRDGNEKLGAMLFIGTKAGQYTDFELEAYAKMTRGILVGLQRAGFAA